MLQFPIYLDNCATTKMDESVLQAILPFFTTYFGNASSHSHSYGWQAEEAVHQARTQVAALIGAQENEIVFTSGATEAVNLALKGIYEAYKNRGNHIITVATEHKAVLDSCRHLEKLGASITYLPVGSDGLINLSDLENAITPWTVLVSVMYANNETGVVQDLKAISKTVHDQNTLLFTDATQAVGKIPVKVVEEGIDLMAFSAHKMYGPKGVGALYVRRKDPRVRIVAQLDGGGQENNMRSGTLNVPGIVGFGQACTMCATELSSGAGKIGVLRDRLEDALIANGNVFINGSRRDRLPNVSNLRFQHRNATEMIGSLVKDIALSAGSACTSGNTVPSHVLKALGLTDQDARSSMRFGLGRFTTTEEIDYVINRFVQLLQ